MSLDSYRHVVRPQNPGVAVPDGDGGFTQTYAAVVPATWRVSVEPATAKDLERVASGTVISTASHVIKGRYHPQITIATRILFQGRLFSVTGVSDPEERHIQTIALCVELLGQALVEDFAWTQPGWISDTPAWVQEGTF